MVMMMIKVDVLNFQVDPPYIGQVKFDLIEHQLLSLPSEFKLDLELSGQNYFQT